VIFGFPSEGLPFFMVMARRSGNVAAHAGLKNGV
jgi:hypothetical protein